MALKNLMGLICDPVAGLVEVPCVKRNVVGAVNAVSCADMALAGITSRVPVDQVIDCMGDVGRRLPVEFRETALGGLAATPFGQSCRAGEILRRHNKKFPCQKAREFFAEADDQAFRAALAFCSQSLPSTKRETMKETT